MAVNHDHFFSYRLDLDVDGTANSLVVDQLTKKRLAAAHPRKSLWVIELEAPRASKQTAWSTGTHQQCGAS